MDMLISILEQGLIFAIMAMGVYITYKILDFPDLSVDGTYPLGAAVTVALISAGTNPLLAMLAAVGAGAVAGLATGLIHVKLKVRDLLSGIITMTALYSVNLHIAGRANVPIFTSTTIFNNNFANSMFSGALAPYKVLIIICIVAIASKLLLDWYLKTKSGFLLRAVGDNPVVVTSLANDKGSVKIIGLVIANALVALSGSVIAQQQRFFEIQMGTGTIVIGLASVIIGINLFRRFYRVKPTSSVIVGSILYKACVALAITYGLSATDMKLVTAVLFLVILVLGRERRARRKSIA
ncbi:MAG: ABC transporter permease [Dehalococcoidales bacterium]|jgi:putative ABC transport system permease protein|nr:ABC transporter permease [Dehalococcoidales bacterium]MDD3265336.1 ABC transporter permease [Dehalococcoidales bacterium]MDD4322706.1 ABC transporter permease [Dehalococcoidales bacterium]MDD4794277.1 ABC transporter permease [Dehalococcoidales bacterium]MDD5122913.1 ABC transporter permease [Dehalococcoidales bacterium]